MDISELFPNRFLKSQQLKKGDATLTILTVAIEKFPGKKRGQEDVKGVITFKETHLAWILNKTNASCLAAMWGRETNAWIGKRVTLWPMPFSNPFTGEQTTALRVRGSPELQADLPCSLQIGRDVVQVTMKKTVPRGKAAANTSPTQSSTQPPAAPAAFVPPTPEEVAAAEAEQTSEISD